MEDQTQAPLGGAEADGSTDMFAGVPDGTRIFFYDRDTLPVRTDEDLVHILSDEIKRRVEPYAVGSEILPILLSDKLSMIISRVPPGMQVPVHNHGLHQITYMLKGELHYGSRVTRAGMGFFTPARMYTWTAGPEGAEFLEVFAGRLQDFVLPPETAARS